MHNQAYKLTLNILNHAIWQLEKMNQAFIKINKQFSKKKIH